MKPTNIIVDQFKALRSSYKPTKYAIVLCHGLLGFDAIDLPGGHRFEYFRGVKKALQKQGAHVVARSVPPMASIELRGNSLYESLRDLGDESGSKTCVNIIAHSMGGLDARYMISKLLKNSDNLEVASLTTLSTPHYGSPVANIFRSITKNFPPSYGAFSELSTHYMTKVFNPTVQNVADVKYFSYGARFVPTIVSPFWLPGQYIQKKEGDNDGMVSVESSMWGDYRGTLDNVDHADIINMTNLKPRRLLNHNYSSPAMYLHIMNDLAQLGF